MLHLGFGESRFPTHPLLKDTLCNAAQNRSYLPSTGTENLKKFVSDYYSVKLNTAINPNQILIGVGSKSLIYAIIQSLDGDILLPRPSWVSYSSITTLNRKKYSYFNLDRENNYSLDIRHLNNLYRQEKKHGGNPKNIILNSPNNPIGNTYSKSEIQSVSNWSRDNDIIILSDEIYSLLTHKNYDHQSPICYYPEKTIIFSGLSKHLSLGGWRIGIAILPENDFGANLISEFNSIASNIWSCVPAPMQTIAEKAFSNDASIEQYITTCRDIHEIRTRYIFDELIKMNINCTKPSGAFYIYLTLKNFSKPLERLGISSCKDLAHHLLNCYNIATLPGSAFGDYDRDLCLRLSTSYLDMETDEKAREVLDIFSNGMNPLDFMLNHHPRTNLFLNRINNFISSLN